jgi:hypothetical protein
VSPKPDSYLENAQLFVGNACLDMLTCSDQDLDSATFVSLTFTNHQNCVRGVRTVSETKFLVSASVVVPSTASFTTLPAALELLASKVPSPQRHASYRLASGRWSGVSPAHVTSALRVDGARHLSSPCRRTHPRPPCRFPPARSTPMAPWHFCAPESTRI